MHRITLCRNTGFSAPSLSSRIRLCQYRQGITEPTDLIGKKVGLRNFQATANLWIRGILEHEYGVPHRSIDWFRVTRLFPNYRDLEMSYYKRTGIFPIMHTTVIK